jgi:cytochrome c553
MMRPLTIAADCCWRPCFRCARAAARRSGDHCRRTGDHRRRAGRRFHRRRCKTGRACRTEGRRPQGRCREGQGLTYTCRGCHGVTGYKNAYPSFHVPRIGGQSAAYLASALTEYREGKRKHPTMQAQAESFSPQDIADIAAYLSTVNVQK